MKKFIYLFLVCLLCSCNSQKSDKSQNSPKVSQGDNAFLCVQGNVRTVKFNNDFFVLDRNGLIVAWYSNGEEDGYPVIFKRDEQGRIISAQYYYANFDPILDSEPSIKNFKSEFTYNDQGYLAQNAYNSPWSETTTIYSEHNNQGWPTAMVEKGYEGDVLTTTAITYSNMDSQGNWLLCKFAHKPVENEPWEDELERIITYYYDGEADDAATQKAISSYQQAIADIPVRLGKEMSAAKEEYNEMFGGYDSDDGGVYGWAFGTWEYSSSFSYIVVLGPNNVKAYLDGELVYNGTYTTYGDELSFDVTRLVMDNTNQMLREYGTDVVFRKVTSSTDVTITVGYNGSGSSSGRSSSRNIPNIYSADSFLDAVVNATIQNEVGGYVQVYRDGLWIGDTMISGFAPRVIRFNKTGGVLTYQTNLDASTLTLYVDFAQGLVLAKIPGVRDVYFTIR